MVPYWRISIGIAALVSFAAVSASAQQAANPTAAATASGTAMLLTKARALEGRGRLDLAAQTWQQILMAEPNQPEALAGLAKYARQNGNNNEANAFLERLRKVNPADKAIGEIEAMRPAPRTANRARLDEAELSTRDESTEEESEASSASP